MLEHAIIEVACERKAHSLRNLAHNGGHKALLYTDLTVDDFPFMPIRSMTSLATPPLQHQPTMISDISLTMATNPIHSNAQFT